MHQAVLRLFRLMKLDRGAVLYCAVWDSWKCDFGFALIHHSMSITTSDTSTFMAVILVGDVLSVCSCCVHSEASLFCFRHLTGLCSELLTAD